jgi:hypothetical protein
MFSYFKNDYSLKTLGLTQNKSEIYHFKKIQLGIVITN